MVTECISGIKNTPVRMGITENITRVQYYILYNIIGFIVFVMSGFEYLLLLFTAKRMQLYPLSISNTLILFFDLLNRFFIVAYCFLILERKQIEK